jgi:1-deoxyxylulose-5-phosphate synthase
LCGNAHGRVSKETEVEYVRLGKSGLKVSPLCLGTMTLGASAWRPWALDRDESRPILKRALDLGINFIDCADWYSIGVGEEVVGQELLKMTRRDQLVLTTKAYYPMGDGPNDRGLSRKHIMESIDASLKRLGTDYVDVFMMHAWDPETPIEETLEALNDVVRAGKALYLGASTMWAWQFSKLIHTADKHAWANFCVMQCQYNLVFREHEFELFPLCEDQGIALTPFSPLARGFLTGDRTQSGEQKSRRSRPMIFRKTTLTMRPTF